MTSNIVHRVEGTGTQPFYRSCLEFVRKAFKGPNHVMPLDNDGFSHDDGSTRNSAGREKSCRPADPPAIEVIDATPVNSFRPSVSPAIEVINANKSFKRAGGSKVHVMENMCLRVEPGTIFALLGPSGCGKTSLLRAIMGQLRLDSGVIKVLGQEPGTPGHNVPGPDCSYQPQENGLLLEFTISQALSFAGRIANMSRRDIQTRIVELRELLELPQGRQQLVTLSGGQKRRVSMAMAMMPMSPVIILDEPTVGIDPVLRNKIWAKLRAWVNMQHITIVITTHYMDEAKLADKLAMLREGRILGQGHPQELLDTHKKDTLEELFHDLAVQADDDRGEGSNDASVSQPEPQLQAIEKTKSACSDFFRQRWFKFYVFWALLMKNIQIFLARKPTFVFNMFLPCIQMILFLWCLAENPHGIPVSIVDHDEGYAMDQNATLPCPECPLNEKFLAPGCDPNCTLSSAFIDNLDPFTYDITYRANEAECHHDVVRARAYLCMYFPPNFTSSSFDKMSYLNPDIPIAVAELYWDRTNPQVTSRLSLTLARAGRETAQELLRPSLMRRRVNQTDVYGDIDWPGTNYMTPGVLISMIFNLALGLTALTYVDERKMGIIERCTAGGANNFEIMSAFIVSQTIIGILQIIIAFVTSVYGFGQPCFGSELLVMVLMYFSSMTGMTLGFMYSAIGDNEQTVIMLAIGTIFPFMIMCGLFWPLESFPVWLRKIAYFIPLTLPGKANRLVMLAGFGWNDIEVWHGFFATGTWIIALFAVTLLIIKIRGIVT